MPREIESELPELIPQIIDYLELEENESFSPDDLTLNGYYVADDACSFVVFEYSADDEPLFAFVQYALRGGRRFDGGCIGCWQRTENESLESSLAEFLEYNPLNNG